MQFSTRSECETHQALRALSATLLEFKRHFSEDFNFIRIYPTNESARRFRHFLTPELPLTAVMLEVLYPGTCQGLNLRPLHHQQQGGMVKGRRPRGGSPSAGSPTKVEGGKGHFSLTFLKTLTILLPCRLCAYAT
jgi:hypothetical protein